MKKSGCRSCCFFDHDTFAENCQTKLALSDGQPMPISRHYLEVFKQALRLC